MTPARGPVEQQSVGARAPRLAPDERREMLIAATLPLLAQHGLKVTSRQIAEAAGVAEGTIFRAFGDKEALIQATLGRAFDPDPLLAELACVDAQLPLRVRVLAVVSILQRRFIVVFNLMLALGMHGPPDDLEDHRSRARPGHRAVLDRIAAILEPDAAKFRCTVPEVVRIMRLLTFSGSHPLITDGQLLTADEITDVLLDGTLQHTGTERGDHRTC